MTNVEGIEVYRTKELWAAADKFKLVARTVQLLGHLPVVQQEGDVTVLYALRPGLFRKPHPRKSKDQSKNPTPHV